jgi:hypothetical protein
MPKLTWRSAAVALLVSADLGFAARASALPTGVRRIARQAPVGVPQTARARIMPLVFRPFRYEVRAAQVPPIKTLPLIAQPQRTSALPALLEFGGFATSFAPPAPGGCAAPRSGVLLANLPATPFTPIVCRRGEGDSDELPTSLVPGRNKNALYGPAYSPRDLDAP